MKHLKKKIDTTDVISLAWSDKISFEEILKKTGLSESQVIKIMRTNLKTKSFKNWRQRVSSRKSKHRKINEFKNDYCLL